MENLKKNSQITARQVRVVKADGTQLGVMDTYTAIKMAQRENVDLIEIVPTANPPVCKLIEFAKYMYEAKKREKEDKIKQREMSRIKDVQLRPHIQDGDLQTKARLIKSFLEDGIRVRVSMSYKGREVTHKDVGQRIVDKLLESIKDHCIVESIKNDHNSILVHLRALPTP